MERRLDRLPSSLAATRVAGWRRVEIGRFAAPLFPHLESDRVHVAYTVGMTSAELWVMERFLPPAAAAARH